MVFVEVWKKCEAAVLDEPGAAFADSRPLCSFFASVRTAELRL